ncbi:hypothetical protein Sa4125_24990 [Aureimonas sp. SA4125]|uniref:DUF2793 domain-containing protein n=1 Tax=Aureimonas sp. SA4125 TaxID=2826993 RepID=UPI001CC5AB9C|nr:DUF2793 domain-containing protein [Aureimonas sp. SA4125]BDA84957.1 hypothetical protein Sa4125_24990 [Aureimonas sp. SA4125]
MEYQAPFGSTDPDAPYVDRNTPGAVAGSKVPAAAIEDPQRELEYLIAQAGLTPSAADLTQVWQAIRSMLVNRGRTIVGLTRIPNTVVESFQVATPPATPSAGAMYVVANGATGAWAGKAGQIAEYTAAGWIFQGAQDNSIIWANDQSIPYRKVAGAWQQAFASESNYGFVILAAGSDVDALTSASRPVVPLHLGRVIKPLRGPQGIATANNWGDLANVRPGYAPRRLTGLGSNAPAQVTGDGSEFFVHNAQDQGSPNAFFRLALPAAVASGKPLLFATTDNAGAHSPWVELIDDRSLKAAFQQRASFSLLFPHVNRIDGVFDFATGANTVTILPTVEFTWRGLLKFNLQEYLNLHGAGALTFTVASGFTHHIRWYPPGSANAPAGTWPLGRWMARNVADTTYNPSLFPEDNAALDGNHDNMLAARVVVSGGGAVTLTRLVNRGVINFNTVLTVPVTGGPDSFSGSATLPLNLAMTPYAYAIPEGVQSTYGAAGASDLRVFSTDVNRYGINVYVGNFSRLTTNPTFRVGCHI